MRRMRTLATLIVAFVSFLPASGRAQQVPCSTCGQNFTRIDLNSVTIQRPSLLAFGLVRPPAQTLKSWRRQAERLGYELVVLDSLPQTIYVANDHGEILWGSRTAVSEARGFVFVSEAHGVGTVVRGTPSGAGLVARSVWYITPPLVRVYLSLGPIAIAVCGVVVAGVGNAAGWRPWQACAASLALLLLWSLVVSFRMTGPPGARAVALREAALRFAAAAGVVVLTALVSSRLARAQAGPRTRAVLPAMVGLTGVTAIPVVLLCVACVFGDCI